MSAKLNPRLAAVYKHLRHEFEVDGPALEELVETLVLNLRDLRQALREAAGADDAAALAEHGHALKGIAANTGQDDLRQAAAALEELARGVDRGHVRLAIEAIDGMLMELGC